MKTIEYFILIVVLIGMTGVIYIVPYLISQLFKLILLALKSPIETLFFISILLLIQLLYIKLN